MTRGRTGPRPTNHPVPSNRIYFVRYPEEFGGGPIKIGVTWNPYGRFANFQVASPWPLTYLGDIAGDEEQERDLHTRFAHLRMRGEWFRPGPELLAYIDEALRLDADRSKEALWAAAMGTALKS